MSFFPSVCLSLRLAQCQSFHLSVCLFVCLSVCLYISYSDENHRCTLHLYFSIKDRRREALLPAYAAYRQRGKLLGEIITRTGGEKAEEQEENEEEKQIEERQKEEGTKTKTKTRGIGNRREEEVKTNCRKKTRN